jgi:hypothetical protein
MRIAILYENGENESQPLDQKWIDEIKRFILNNMFALPYSILHPHSRFIFSNSLSHVNVNPSPNIQHRLPN